MAMTREDRKAIIMEDFNWLKDIEIHEIDGKLLLGDKELPYNIGHIFYEKEFVQKWLMGFALGNYHGINYFPLEKWAAMTNNGTRAVMVVDDNHKPVLLIPPLLAHKLTPQDFRVMRAVSWHMHHQSADTQFGKDPNLNLQLSKEITNRMDETKRITYTEMILPEFFEKYNIVPKVEQNIHYIKDVIRGKKDPMSNEDVNERLRPILYKAHRGEPITKEDRQFVEEAVRGKFSIAGVNDQPPEEAVKEEQEEAPDNPLEC